MVEITKLDKAIASLCKGEDKKSDGMMLMAPDTNWDQFLTPVPCAVAVLGDLMLISADTDFSLEDKPPRGRFKLLRYPKSFRSSFMQVSNAGWSAFNEAHTSMDQIRLHSGNVDGHVKTVVKFLLQGSPEEVNKMIPMSLNKIQEIADESLRLAQAIEERFVGVIELTGELLEACTNTKGVYDQKTNETEIAIQVAKTQRKSRMKEIEESERRLKNMENEVKGAQEEFKQTMANVPSGMSLLAGEAMVESIRNITSFPKLVKGTIKRKIEKVLSDEGDESDKLDDAYIDKEISKEKVYKQISTINRYVCMLTEIANGGKNDAGDPYPDRRRISKGDLQFVEKSLITSKGNIDGETNSGHLRERVLKVCDESISVCSTLLHIQKSMNVENREELIAGAMMKTKFLQKKSQALEVEASKALGKNPLENKSPHLSKMPVGSNSPSAVQAATENARYKTELAKETLKDAKKRQEKAADELKESNEKLTKVLMQMAQHDLKKIDFDSIRDTLVKGIKALAEVREQWGKMVRFFQMLSNLIKCCLHSSLTDFVDQAEVGRELQMKDRTTLLSNIFRDVIFEQALKASQIAYVVRTISGTYVQISDEHLMDRITCLGRLVALDPKKDMHEIQMRRKELHNGCIEAQKAIRAIVMKQKEDFNRQIEERIAKIEQLERSMLAIQPERVQEIKESISEGRANFSEEDMDDLI